VAVGRRKGHLTNLDLETVLPVETMSAEDIAMIVVYLEDAGVSIDLDETLLALAPPSTPMHSKPTEILLPANDTGSPLPLGSDRTLSAVEVPLSRDRPIAEERVGPSAHRAVLLTLILIFLLAVIALVLGR
jgi:hypothetical protein